MTIAKIHSYVCLDDIVDDRRAIYDAIFTTVEAVEHDCVIGEIFLTLDLENDRYIPVEPGTGGDHYVVRAWALGPDGPESFEEAREEITKAFIKHLGHEAPPEILSALVQQLPKPQ